MGRVFVVVFTRRARSFLCIDLFFWSEVFLLKVFIRLSLWMLVPIVLTNRELIGVEMKE